MQNAPWAGFSSCAAVTASDSTLVTCRALAVNVTVAGNIAVNPAQTAGTSVAIALPVGFFILPIELNQGRVMATGTTATATIVALA